MFSLLISSLDRMSGQFCDRKGLHDLVVALETHQEKWHHLEIGKSVTRSNLSKV